MLGPQILIVEDDIPLGEQLARRLSANGYAATLRSHPNEVLDALSAGVDWDVVLLDIGLPEVSGIEVLYRLRESSKASVIMVTGDDTASTAATCMRAGAFHYITKPFEPIQLFNLVGSAARYAQLRRQLADGAIARAGIVGVSKAARTLRALVERIGGQDVNVLLQGESGTGKELVARTLHAHSRRAGRPFVALNCGAIPPSLIDSELFGHVRGAFTGATADRDGVFVEADGGTLFLDEVGDMPIEVQARLLRVLQEREVRPVGSSEVRHVDVRVVAATHVDLPAAVREGRFREDLFYRLNVVALPIAPLRERVDDLALLAAHFLVKHGGPKAPMLSPDALELMATYAWPGNIRELENAVLYALAMQRSVELGPEALPPAVAGRKPAVKTNELDLGLPLVRAKREAVASFERSYLIKVLKRARGSVAEAARLAGVDRANFRRLLARHKLDPASFR